MARWNYRHKADHSQGGCLEEADLKKMLDAEVLGEEHEFQPVGQEIWLSAFKAIKQLNRPEVLPSPPADAMSRQWEPPPPEAPISAAPSATVRRFPSQPPPSLQKPPAARPEPKVLRPIEPGRPETPLSAASAGIEASGRAQLPKLSIENRRPETRHRRVREDEGDEETDMTPMIDMTFLLLIFFMVSSTMTPASQSELPGATAGRMVPTQDRVELMAGFPSDIKPDPSQQGGVDIPFERTRFTFADRPEEVVAAEQLAASLQERLSGTGQGRLVLYADRHLPARVVNQVIRIAKQAGAKETTVGVSVPKSSDAPAEP